MASFFARLLIAIALGVGCGPIAYDLLLWAGRSALRPPPDVLASLAGALLGLLFLLWKRPNWFIHTYIHEHAHLLVYVALHWRMPTGLQVSDGQGGAVEHIETGAIRSTLVQIAPYTLPLLLTPVLLLRHFLFTEPDAWRQALSGLGAFLYLQHLQALFHNIRLNWRGEQADLVKVGRPLAFVLIALALMLLSAWTLRALWSGFPSGM